MHDHATPSQSAHASTTSRSRSQEDKNLDAEHSTREKHAAVRRWRALTHCAGTKDQCVEGDALAPRLCVLRIELRPIEAVDLTKPVQRRGAARRASGTAKRHDSE
jgi:hypothetical protein